MVGGSGSLSSSVSKPDDNSDSGSKSISVNISPNVGYFITDKLSFGTLYQYRYVFSEYVNGKGWSKSSNLGPFIRFYILKPVKTTNLFLETSYNFSTIKEDKNTFFDSKIGAVYFLNSTVGLELTLKYSIKKYKYDNGMFPDDTEKAFTLGLGFQIHLEKENN
jgi:hypothetical protein